MAGLIILLVLLSSGAGVIAGFSGKAWIVSSNANRGLLALRKSQFAQIASSSTSKQLAAPKLKVIELKSETPKMLEAVTVAEVNSYVDTATLPTGLRRKATAIADALFAAQKLVGLSVEDAHDLSVVNEQLLTAVRLFESLPTKRQNSKEVTAELAEQLEVLFSAVYDIRESYTENVVNQMKTNTGFLRTKFNKNNGLQLEKGSK